MIYPFLTLNDGTEIVHSEMNINGKVKVYIEKPDVQDCFHHATCYLPKYDWEDIYGFTDKEMEYYKAKIKSLAHLILRFAKEGGFENASVV